MIVLYSGCESKHVLKMGFWREHLFVEILADKHEEEISRVHLFSEFLKPRSVQMETANCSEQHIPALFTTLSPIAFEALMDERWSVLTDLQSAKSR